ncbi:hypothetical protein AJ80_06488 [Polytolypa hystricis UAMH7299]|uniref:WDR5-like beta-propeller domain-containing protein n=1 Tax=Polytolypa hystricis (strain UAMH7299) TaxID=1447883 RepID=A0A2B7XMK2_POLH7|nr:hypothetical protein AJ80_06488 [Polytolypa hystricis UAMH7299]
MNEEVHPSKKRRLDTRYSTTTNTTTLASGGSSSDELGANSDTERRRASWVQRTPKVYKSSRAEPAARSDSESPDELAADYHLDWQQRRRNAMTTSQPDSRQESSREGTPMESQRGDESEEEPFENDDLNAADNRPVRTRTPTPPPPPPKPERLYYKEKFILKAHKQGVSVVQFSPDGSMLASCGADATIKVWDVSTGRLIHSFEGHLAGISTISWSPDSSIIASGSDDKSIRLWHVSTGKPHPHPFLGHHNYIYSVAFSPKGNILVSGSYDEAVFLWDVRSGRIIRTLPAHSDPVAGVDFVRDGTLIVSCAHDGLIRVWDTATGQCLRTLVHEDNPPVSAVKFSPNGKYVLAWSLDNCVRLWDYVEGKCIKTYQGHTNSKYSLCGGFGTYGGTGGLAPIAFAVSGSEDGSVVCWDVISKKVLQKLEGHTDVVLGVDTLSSTDGNRLIASCGLDRTIRVWEENPAEGEEEDKEDRGEKEDTVEAGRAGGIINQQEMQISEADEAENELEPSKPPDADADSDIAME